MLLEGTIYPEEITHVAAGLKWFTWLWVRDCPDLHKDKKEKCLQELSQWNPCLNEEEEEGEGLNKDTVEAIMSQHGLEMQEVIDKFHRVVREFFGGVLKPPFNHQARAKAGFTKKWYEPLTVKQQ